MTNLTPSPANLLATETPCLGSETSSPNSVTIFWLRMPPAALMSAAACSTPFFLCAPVAALGPVIGPPTPNLTCAVAEFANTNARLSETPSVVIVFIVSSPYNWKRKVRICRNVTSRRLAAPAQWAVRLVDPAILADHLRGTRGLKSDQAEEESNCAVDDIIMQ